jgi:hypothetical protein
MRVLTLLIIALLLCVLASNCYAQSPQVKSTQIIDWDGYAWRYIDKGSILGLNRMVHTEEFLSYSNGTTGITPLALASAPDNTNVVTAQDWNWGSTATANGTILIKGGVGGTAVLNTTHVADADASKLTWREANWGIGYNPSFEAVLFINPITLCLYEAGWYVDANDCIMFRFDPTVSTTKWLVVYENNNGGEVVYTTTATVTANRVYNLRIDITSPGGFKAYVDGKLVRQVLTANTLRNVGFKPHFYAKLVDAAHAAAKVMTIDTVRISQDRLR